MFTPLCAVLQSVEWDMLLFFAAQFVMVEAAAEIGLINMIGGWLDTIIRAAPPSARKIVAIQIIMWLSAIISAILDNIPYTITMVPVIEFIAASGLGLDLMVRRCSYIWARCRG